MTAPSMMITPLPPLEDRLHEAYERHFTRHKRQPTRALGWPATLWLVQALTTWQARRVLECGAGWSTTALRLWEAEQADRVVQTTDHKVAWLELARAECGMEGLSVERFADHEAFAAQPPESFDAVLVDLADTPTRLARLEEFVTWTRPGGFVVFDDWHVPEYALGVQQWFLDRMYPPPTPVLPSMDEWGRYLAVWRRPEV